MKVEQWLDTELGVQIWKKKYQYKDETFEQWLDRVSGNDKELRRLIKERKFLFGGRTLSNRSLNHGSYSNCYSSGYVLDSLEDILDVNKKLGMTYKAEGGQGVSLSKIRPKGTLIKGRYESDGIVPVMELFNKTTESIMQGGCIHEDELVLTSNGYVEIKNIKVGDKVWTKEGFIPVNFVFDKGEQEIFKVTTTKGNSIRTTIDHKYCVDGFTTKKLSDLKVGDTINLITKHHFDNIEFNDLAYFLGVFNGDGHVVPKKNGGTITLHRSQKYIGDKLIEIINSLGFPAYYTNEILPNALRVYLVKDFLDYLDTRGLLKNHAKDILIPDFVMKGNDSIKASYIAGAIDSDGSVYTTSFKYNTISQIYSNQIHLLLSSLGFFPSTHVIERDESRQTMYVVRDSFRLGQCLIPSLKIERSNIQFTKNSRYSTPYSIESENFSRDEHKHLKKISKTSKIGLHTYLGAISNIEGLTRAPMIMDTISQITNDGLAHVYDISLESEHLFDCNGIYISNSRKGALMLSIDIKHKEALTFINIKSDVTRINKANLSVEIDDEFMEIVEKSYKTNTEIPLNVIRTYESQKIEYEIIPIIIYKQLIKQAHLSAEPGVLFTNKMRNYNLMEFCDDYQIETVNPCGEQPLPKDGACNLGSINISEYVINPFTPKAYFDTESFAKDILISIRALDDIIDENMINHAVKEQVAMSKNYRNVGLGLMGVADALIKLGIRYGSEESLSFAEAIGFVLLRNAVLMSSVLAKEKGAFPAYTPNLLKATILKDLFDATEFDFIKQHGLRNCSLLSIAPTGSLGAMLNISTGIEPNFAISYQRKTEALSGEKQTFDVYCGVADQYIKQFKTKELPSYFVTSHDLDWKERIDFQSTFQRYIDTAISSTINLHKDISVENVERLYLYAWEKGLKGITIYRDGCRDGILSLHGTKKDTFFVRPEILPAKVIHFKNDSDKWIAFISEKEGLPFEIFTGPSDLELFPIPTSIKQGEIIKVKEEGKESRYDFRYIDSYGYRNTLGGLSRCFDKEYWNYARLVSGMLRQQVKVSAIVEIIDGMQTDSQSLHSWKNGVIRSLKTFIPDGTEATKVCPECKEPLVYNGGCLQCNNCGWSKCS